ncbi:MAG: acetoacetate--CoA ligase [Rubrobacteraceae bacterium]
MTEATEGTLLWEPSEEFKEGANISHYMRWLEENKNLSFDGYEELWEWSVTDLEEFWTTIWEYFEIKASKPHSEMLGSRRMPGAEWFPGAELNYAEHVLRNANKRPDEPAILSESELRELGAVTWRELHEKVAALAEGLKSLGVGRGDRVVAYIPNIPEAIVALLATSSLGAVWSSCSPDFGAGSVVDRFDQIEPKVLIASDGYRYAGKDFDRMEVVARIRNEISSLENVILIPYLDEQPGSDSVKDAILWHNLLTEYEGAELEFEQVPFDHPLWVLYSSGTTGLPKALVHGHGGILLEHLKKLSLHMDVKEGDPFFWFTTTGWMMWNVVASSLLVGGAALLYDGSPGYPDLNVLWEFAEKTGMACFGASASYLTGCRDAGLTPGEDHDLSALRSIGSTGSPLPPEGFEWVYGRVKEEVWLFSTSGGTDLCTAFVGGCPILPVRAGELQCRSLGASVHAFDEEGLPLVEEVGELVITEPMPSMPVFLWGDEGGERYRESYFDVYPGVWRHGDWIKVTDHGSAVIYGRSDSTINRGGVRMGTSEIYRAVSSISRIRDSLVVDVAREDGGSVMPLFVILEEDEELDDELKKEISKSIRENCSPRHVPDEVYEIEEIPQTLNGKKLEVPVKKILSGTPPDEAASRDSLSNPGSLDTFAKLAKNFE